MSAWTSDLRVLYHLALGPLRGGDHASRLESFYSGQAGAYDDFRRRLLQGREAMYSALPTPPGGTWVDLGGGTAAGLQWIGPAISALRKIYVVDLAPSLLSVARRRIVDRGWENAEIREADASEFRPERGPADVVTFSYALTMIPDWFAALENAWNMLRPGGWIGVVDFYISRKFPGADMARHGWGTRAFWPLWFGIDNVVLSPDHLPWLRSRFETVRLFEGRAKLPYLPMARAPYYMFVGRKPAQHVCGA